MVPGGFLRLWDAKTGKEIRRFKGHKGPVTGLAFSPDGRQLLSASPEYTARLWDVETGKELRTTREEMRETYEESRIPVAFTPDGRRFLWGLTLWDIEKWRAVRDYKNEPRPYRVGCTAISPDGTRFLSGDTDGYVRLWDLETGKELWKEYGSANHSEVTGVAFSPDGKWALSGSSGWVGWGPDAKKYPVGGVNTVRLFRLPD